MPPLFPAPKHPYKSKNTKSHENPTKQHSNMSNNTMALPNFEPSIIPSLPSSLHSAVTLDLLAAAILSVATAFFLVLILCHIVFNLLSRLQGLNPIQNQNAIIDQTQNNNNNNNRTHHQALLHRSLARYNAQLLDALERLVCDVDERRGQRLRALRRLPPLISYGRHEKRSEECVICLEDFEDGESCQVFPFCNHIFHTSCIDHWLKNRPTCPVCRHCILDV